MTAQTPSGPRLAGTAAKQGATVPCVATHGISHRGFYGMGFGRVGEGWGHGKMAG